MIRISMLVGVSTDEQAKADRGSIDDQIRTCQRAIESLGGQEVGCYVMDGYSRTGYDSLSEAMTDIPPLGDAIRAAEANEYDVLILDNFDRLGDLGILLSNRFKKIKKQLYSARQSGRLQDPDTYDPYMDESGDIGIGVGFLLQKYRIAKLRRGYNLGIAKRVEDGLHALKYPIGYKKISKDVPLELDPVTAPLIVMLKDEFLNGSSIAQLQKRAIELGLTTANKKGKMLYRVLLSPFYAGKVYHGYKRGKNPDALKDGLHPALWSWDEHLRIVSEMQRRNHKSPRTHSKIWSGLLRCSTCGKGLWNRAGVWRCIYPGTDHVTMPDELANDIIPTALVKALKNYRDTPIPEPATVDTDRALADISRKQQRIQEGYEHGIYNASQAQEKIAELRRQADALKDGEEVHRRKVVERETFLSNRAEVLQVIDQLPQSLRNAPPREANAMLRGILSHIEITTLERGKKYRFNFHWRDL